MDLPCYDSDLRRGSNSLLHNRVRSPDYRLRLSRSRITSSTVQADSVSLAAAEVTTEQIMSLTKLAKAAARAETKPTVTVDSPEFEDAPVIESQSFKVYNAYLSKGDILTIEAGADDWIRVELVSLTESAKLEAGKKYEWERGKEGKNLTVEYEARRNGNWKIYIFNLAKTQPEVGVTLTVEQ